MTSKEQAQPVETELPTSSLIELLNLKPGQFQTFSTEISRWRGWAEFWVHTHYRENIFETERFNIAIENQVPAEKYRYDRRRMIQTAGKTSHLPVIAFVEGNTTHEELLSLYQPLLDAGGKLFFVKTTLDKMEPIVTQSEFEIHSYAREFFSSQTVLMPSASAWKMFYHYVRHKSESAIPPDCLAGERQLSGMDRRYAREDLSVVQSQLPDYWSQLLSLWKHAGLRGAIVRGRNYFEYLPEDLKGKSTFFNEMPIVQYNEIFPSVLTPGGCVGALVRQLAMNGVTVKVSNIVYPTKPTLKEVSLSSKAQI